MLTTAFAAAVLLGQAVGAPWGPAQTGSSLFGLTYAANRQAQVVLIDPVTGNVSNAVEVPIAGEISLGPSTFDPPSQTYFFICMVPTGLPAPAAEDAVKLVSVTLPTGAVRVTELNCSTIHSIQYDAADAQLLGIAQHSASTWLVSIDEFSGHVLRHVPITVPGGGYSAVPGVSAFDIYSRTYYTLISGGDEMQRVVSINSKAALLHTGRQTATPSISNGLDCNLINLKCETTTGLLLGIGTCEHESGLAALVMGQPQLLRLNGTSGAIELREQHEKGSGYGMALYASAFDTVGATFMSLLDFSDVSGGGGSHIYSVNSEVFSIACGSVDERDNMHLQCESGIITSVDFASFGTPEGECGGYQIGWCHSSVSRRILESACLGVDSCSLAADRLLFGDPCVTTAKVLSVQVTCSGHGGRNGTDSHAPVSTFDAQMRATPLLDIFLSDAPYITKLIPGSSLLAANTPIQVDGSNFFRMETVQCVFGETVTLAAAVGKSIVCVAPTGTEPGILPFHMEFIPAAGGSDSGSLSPRRTNSVPFNMFETEVLRFATPAMGPSTGGTVLRISSGDFIDGKHADMICRFDNVTVPARLEHSNDNIATCVAPPAAQLPGRRLVRQQTSTPTYDVDLTGRELFNLVMEETVASTEWVVNRWLSLPADCAGVSLDAPWWRLGLLHSEYGNRYGGDESPAWTAEREALINSLYGAEESIQRLTIGNITSFSVDGRPFHVQGTSTLRSVFPAEAGTQSAMIFTQTDEASRGFSFANSSIIEITAESFLLRHQGTSVSTNGMVRLLVYHDHALLISGDHTSLIDGESLSMIDEGRDCQDLPEGDANDLLQTMRDSVASALQTGGNSEAMSRAAEGLPLVMELQRYDQFSEINGTLEEAFLYNRNTIGADLRAELRSELDRISASITDIPNPFMSAVQDAAFDEISAQISDATLHLSLRALVSSATFGAVNQSLFRSEALGLQTRVEWEEVWADSVTNSSVDVSFSNNGRQFVSNNLTFTYYEPVSVLRLEPISGPDSGGSTISIHGANFIPGPGEYSFEPFVTPPHYKSHISCMLGL